MTDTGPLLHFGEADLWDLLAASGTIASTPCVVAEWRSKNAPMAALPAWLHEEAPSAETQTVARGWVQAGLLHAGEAESLAHAKATHADVFLTDDTAAREMARSLNVNVRGSLGIILMLAAKKRLNHEQASVALDQLWRDSTLWLSPHVRDEAATLLAKIFAG
ncbi:hypothetical protein [Geminisphaera colitermitum]|uniref:hypothetical protein n=1 Tax=Geminisphaera colitermitum TaxID=1148786 RepID=UPI0012FEC1AA|nr:hypothetical protein [Geminisphaera colitermitum]